MGSKAPDSTQIYNFENKLYNLQGRKNIPRISIFVMMYHKNCNHAGGVSLVLVQQSPYPII